MAELLALHHANHERCTCCMGIYDSTGKAKHVLEQEIPQIRLCVPCGVRISENAITFAALRQKLGAIWRTDYVGVVDDRGDSVGVLSDRV